MIINSINVTNLDFENFIKIEIFKQNLYNQNNYLRFYKKSKIMIYANWFTKKSTTNKKFISIIIKFISSKLTNEIILRNLNYANNFHETKRYIRNCKFRQYFRCWNYNHYVYQCFIEQQNFKCKKYTSHHNAKKYQNKFNKCVNCQNKYQTTMNIYSKRKHKLQKLNKIKNMKKILYSTKSKSIFSFAISIEFIIIFENINFIFKNVAITQKKN